MDDSSLFCQKCGKKFSSNESFIKHTYSKENFNSKDSERILKSDNNLKKTVFVLIFLDALFFTLLTLIGFIPTDVFSYIFFLSFVTTITLTFKKIGSLYNFDLHNETDPKDFDKVTKASIIISSSALGSSNR